MSKMRTLLASLLLAPASGLFAQATYTYRGNAFSSFARGTVPGSDHISVTFILTAALQSNITTGTEVYPVTWTISDGINVISSANPASFTAPASFVFTTDATGKMTSWEIVGYGTGGVSMSTTDLPYVSIEDTSQYNNAAGQQIGAGGVLDDPGTWTSTIPPPQALSSFMVSPSSLVFNVQVGASGVIPKTIDVNSSGAPITFIVSATSQGSNWLSVIGSIPVSPFGSWQATTPISVSVFVDATQLTRAGTYTGTVTITSTSATNSPQSVPVTVNVGSPSSLVLSQQALSFSATVGTPSLPVQVVNISLVPPNSSLPPPTAAVLTGNNWLSIGDATSGSFPVSVKPSGLAVGTYSGSIVVSVVGASNSPFTVPVTLTITAQTFSLAVSPTMLSFSATAGSPPPPTQNLSVSIAPPNSSLSGATAAVTQGGSWLSVSNVGPGLFAVSVNPTGLAIGTYSGSIAVSVQGASNSPAAIPVTLTVAGVTVSGVLNAASYAKNTNGTGSPVAPGSLVQIYTTLPGATSANAATLPFPTSLGGVSVTFNGTPAAISAVIPTGAYPLINAQVPFEVLTSGPAITANVIVTVNQMASAPFPVSIVPAAPGIFTTTQSGQGQAILFSLTGQIATPTNPISRGATAVLYTTGLGALLPGVADGAASPVSQSIATPTVWIGVPNGKITAEVLYAGQAPDYPGVNQINIVIPEGVAAGNAIPLQIQTADGSLTPSNVTIAIQ